MGQLVWMDAETHQPPEESLLLVIEHKDSVGRVASMEAGFYADGEYCVGGTFAGDLLSEDHKVIYWALPVWPTGYDVNGIWQGDEIGKEVILQVWLAASGQWGGRILRPDGEDGRIAGCSSSEEVEIQAIEAGIKFDRVETLDYVPSVVEGKK